ncbi:hypothetical protein H5397_16525 [Propioniciclava sp. MC1683]|uniref:hypothetical protein n=1 Tax=Propioniciclava sp. MC1683 TaxID=2760309 RepID=UPI00160102E6|nr:hypothetical protein [Propioniciclava sp. MC1683]MBB1503003.1 hypothetical protein [Propioniciclava sp. MC1683]
MKERTVAGLAAANASGKRVGRPSKITSDRTKLARGMASEGRTVVDIARVMGVSSGAGLISRPEAGRGLTLAGVGQANAAADTGT